MAAQRTRGGDYAITSAPNGAVTLRHTAAALAMGAEARPKAIADRLEHASITTTLNT
jgi:integrase